MWAMFAFMAVYVRRQRRYRPYRLFERFDWPEAGRIRALLALGLPIAASVISEAGLFSAVGLLMGTLGRGALGEMIEDRGYYDVFILTTAIGFVAVALCIGEWVRQSRKGEAAGVMTPEVQPAE